MIIFFQIKKKDIDLNFDVELLKESTNLYNSL